jgi:hypothetical protein
VLHTWDEPSVLSHIHTSFRVALCVAGWLLASFRIDFFRRSKPRSSLCQVS